MARIPNGINGDFIGTAGNVNGYMRNGVNFVRSRRRKSSAPMTPKRLAQQQKIKVCNEFTRPFCGTGFFNKTFPAYGHSGTGFNRATSAIMNLAIAGAYPDTVIDYPEVLISSGPLPPAKNPITAVSADGTILFSWEDNSGNGTAKTDDKVVVVAYFPATKSALFSMGASVRKDGHAVLEAPHRPGEIAQTWIGFLSADEKDAANSVYSGAISL
ncbi:MAG TPA: DUF6266 family protein [Hanamia sp.]|jgi:hypothetical protein|nr:DUF6266 family protein [Hanamia sp.]